MRPGPEYAWCHLSIVLHRGAVRSVTVFGARDSFDRVTFNLRGAGRMAHGRSGVAAASPRLRVRPDHRRRRPSGLVHVDLSAVSSVELWSPRTGVRSCQRDCQLSRRNANRTANGKPIGHSLVSACACRVESAVSLSGSARGEATRTSQRTFANINMVRSANMRIRVKPYSGTRPLRPSSVRPKSYYLR